MLPAPVGEYAMSCLARERMFEYFSDTAGIPVAILRLNYATDMRYGVLVDLARRVSRREPVDVTMGYFNTIWQGDANAMALAALTHASTPASIVNIAGPEEVSVRSAATELARLLGTDVTFTGSEADDALLSNGSRGLDAARPAPCRRRTVDRLDRRLDAARRRPPGQADTVRIARRTILMSGLPAGVLAAIQDGRVIPAHPLALHEDGRFDEQRQRALTRYYAAAGSGGLAVGVHTTQFAIRNAAIGLFEPVLAIAAEEMDSRGRAARRAADPDWRHLRSDGSSPVGGGSARPPRLPRRTPQPGGDGRRGRGRARGALRGRRRPHPAGRLLPAAVGGRPAAVLRLLAPLRRDPRRRRHQNRAVQPLSDPRRRPGGGRCRTRRHRALHGQRRCHRRRPRDALPVRRRRTNRSSAVSSAGCSATGPSGRGTPCRCSASVRRRRAPDRSRRRCCSAASRSPTPTRRSSTPPMASPAASLASRKCCGGKGSSAARGVWTRTKSSAQARPPRSIASAAPIRILRMTPSFAPIWMRGSNAERPGRRRAAGRAERQRRAAERRRTGRSRRPRRENPDRRRPVPRGAGPRGPRRTVRRRRIDRRASALASARRRA